MLLETQQMPTVFRKDGFRFFFFSNEGNEPAHVHVESGDGYAKFWLLPFVKLAESARYNDKILNKLGKLIEEDKEILIRSWNEFFKNR